MSYSWRYPQVNGGMGNVVAAHPTMEGTFQLGGDLWGWYLTQNAGVDWLGTMQGLSGIGSIYARGVCFSLINPPAAYVAVGVLKSGGGYFGVTSGIKMNKRTGPTFGGNLASGAAGVMPRPVGRLIDVSYDAGTEHVVTAAYNGIFESADQGKTFTKLLASSFNWKAVAALGNREYLACKYNTTGVVHLKGSSVSNVAAVGTIHDMNVIAGICWAVGPNGVFRWDGNGLVKHSAATSFFSGKNPLTIAGSADGQILLIGTSTAFTGLSTDGGQTWNQIGTTAHVDMTTFAGNPHWLASVNNGWGGSHFSSSMAAIDQVNPKNMMIAGRQGAWGTHDGGNKWHPCGPYGGEISAIAAGPGSDEFKGNDTDWTGWHTTDAFKHTTTKQAQSGLHSGLSVVAGGHTYKISGQDITKDGQSIADDHFRGGCVNPKALAVTPTGKIVVGQYGGTIMLGTPA